MRSSAQWVKQFFLIFLWEHLSRVCLTCSPASMISLCLAFELASQPLPQSEQSINLMFNIQIGTGCYSQPISTAWTRSKPGDNASIFSNLYCCSWWIWAQPVFRACDHLSWWLYPAIWDWPSSDHGEVPRTHPYVSTWMIVKSSASLCWFRSLPSNLGVCLVLMLISSFHFCQCWLIWL